MVRNSFVDESTMKLEGEPLEYENVFWSPKANGLVVEEISMEEFLAAREELSKKEKEA